MNLSSKFVQVLLALLLSGFFALADNKPNIIFILADDLGYGDIEPFGQQTLKTPQLNRMAEEGIIFTDHYAGAPVCAPSRSTLMTGQHTGNTPIRGNRRDIIAGVEPLAHNVSTIAEMLKQHTDYTTALFGRWHLGGVFSDSQPHQRGFDEFFGALSKYYKPSNTYYRPDLYHNGDLYLIEENNNGVEGIHREDLITEKALEFIEEHQKKPFFLYMAYSFVHEPLQPVPGENLYDGEDWPQEEINFAHNLARLDRYVGQFMGKLEELGIAENTLVIFTSDNGPHAEGHDPDFFDSNGPLKGYKRDLYEGGIRIPFIAWWPGRIEGGSESDHLSAFWDLMPTVADLAGIDAPAQTDGISYLPTLLGEKQEQHTYLYWEFKERTPRQAIRMGDWKGQYFIEHERFELYDLSQDIGEENDLAAQHPEIVAELRVKMDEAHSYNHRFPITNTEKFVRVSSRNPRYFEYEDGTPFIPIGVSIPWSRTTEDPVKAMDELEEYLDAFATNGGNFVRVWLSAPIFEIEHEKAYAYDYRKKLMVHDRLLNIAKRNGIKLKLCFENFRQLLNRPAPFVGSVPFDKPIYHVSHGGPFETFDDYLRTQTGRNLYLSKLQFYSNAYGDHPSVAAWELWNEMNSVNNSGGIEEVMAWTEEMLAEAQEIFPSHMIVQSLGSYDDPAKKEAYRMMAELDQNEFQQVHRYIDLGSNWYLTKGPMDLLTAEAVRDMLEIAEGKPVVLAETGGVEPRHAGPLKLYEEDFEGVILHDSIFAPFFSGSAGSGQTWHWHHYIAKNDLWYHYGIFKKAIKGINPLNESFEVIYTETPRTRNYVLKGNHTLIAWLRDVESPWLRELQDKIPAETIKDFELHGWRELQLPREVTAVDCYLPWQDKWVNVNVVDGMIMLPDFRRSIVIRASY